MPNETKRIAVRPNQGSALQRAVDDARQSGTPISIVVHNMAEIAESTLSRLAKREKASCSDS